MDRRDLDTWNDFDDLPGETGLPCAECGRSDVPTWDEENQGYPMCNDCFNEHYEPVAATTRRFLPF